MMIINDKYHLIILPKISNESFIDNNLWKRSYIYDNSFTACVVPEICKLNIAVILLWACDIMLWINGLLPYVWFISCNLDNSMLVSCAVTGIDTDAVVSIKYRHTRTIIKNIKIPNNPYVGFSIL